MNGQSPATPRHFLDLDIIPAAELRAIIDDARARKTPPGADTTPLTGKNLAMVFSKPSTRTRVSFEIAMRQLGGGAIMLDQQATQLGRGESIADTARVLSGFVDALMLRTDAPANLDEMAAHATIPVVNGLTDRTHPCQVMADILTFEEKRGSISGAVIAWTGDGNNVAHSWIQAAARFGFELRVATPPSLRPAADIVAWANQQGATVDLVEDAAAAVAGADCIVTDTWVSMGDDSDGDDTQTTPQHRLLMPYQVNDALLAQANPDAIFMHCLPAHRGEEVTASVIDGPQSAVWEEAENRLHVQKSILLWCLAPEHLIGTAS